LGLLPLSRSAAGGFGSSTFGGGSLTSTGRA
jgi:hypothetical protein